MLTCEYLHQRLTDGLSINHIDEVNSFTQRDVQTVPFPPYGKQPLIGQIYLYFQTSIGVKLNVDLAILLVEAVLRKVMPFHLG